MVAVERAQTVALQVGSQVRHQPECDVGVRARVGRRIGDRDDVEGRLLASGAHQVGERRELDVQPVEGERLEPERLLAHEVRGDHRVEADAHARRTDAVVREQRHAEVQVVPGLGDAVVTEHRPQRVHDHLGRELPGSSELEGSVRAPPP